MATRHFDTYIEYARILRTWLVAYGIGAPVLVLTNDALSAQFISKPEIKYFGSAFLLGVMIQVALAFLNKVVMWTCYYGEEEDEEDVFKKTWIYKSAHWLSNQFLIDIALDLLTICLFCYATLGLFKLLLPH